ncbi:MAG: transglycosylase SLT domain-containing protein [Pseudonocardiaceae bacterium]|nr:transglycosylase SLT domain-containing protein [Pseudonocardiaceae bacterium]
MAKTLRVNFIGDTSDLEKSVDQGTAKIRSFGQKVVKIAAAAGAAAGVAVGAALTNAINVEGANAKLAGQLGLVGRDAKRAGAVAGRVYSQGWGENLGAVHDAVRGLVQNANVSVKAVNLEPLVRNVTVLTDTFGVSAGEITTAIGGVGRAFGTKPQKALDSVTKLLQTGGDRATDLGDTLTEYPQRIKTLGLSGQQFFGLINQGLAAGGRNTDVFGDSLAELNIRISSGEAAKGMQMLGINASQATAAISAGGPGAQAALDQIFDKLRAIQDPTRRARVATELFGSVWENAGEALFALDPSEAVASLGNVEGASNRLTESQKNAAQQIEAFKRSAISLATQAIGGFLLPKVTELAGFLNRNLKPTIDAVVRAFRENRTAVEATVSVLGGMLTALLAMKVIGSVIAGVKGLRLAVIALNAAMRANVIGIVITALAGLVGGLIYAYKNSETFRNIVNAVFRAVAAVATWLWNNVLKPVFNFIGGVFRANADRIGWAWRNVIKPAWDALVAVLQFLWNNVLRPIFQRIGDRWNAMGVGIRAVWRNVIRPAWDALVGGLRWVRDRFREIVDWVGRKWDQLRGLLARPINAVIRTVFNNGILRAWNWAAGLLPGVDKANKVPEFRWARGGIHEQHQAQITKAGGPLRIWSEPETAGEAYIPLAASKRQRSTGILAEVADRFGLDVLPRHLATFAFGGVVDRALALAARPSGARVSSAYRPGDSGYHGRGKAVDLVGNLPGINRYLAKGWPNSTQLIYTPGTNLLNGRPHRYNAATRADHFDHVHWAQENLAMVGNPALRAIGGGLRGAFNFVRDQIRGAFERITNPLIDGLPKAPPAFKDMGRGVATKSRDSLLNWMLGEADKVDGASDPGGAGVQRWRPLVQQMLRLVGQPLGHTGITLRRMNQESGGNPRAINNWDVNARRGTPSKGLMQVIDPTFRAFRHPRLPNNVWHPGANVAASMRYALSRYGSLPSAYNRPGGYADGGIVTGPTMATLGEDGAEAIVPLGKPRRAREVMDQAGLGGVTKLYQVNINATSVDGEDVRNAIRRMEMLDGAY